MADQFTKEQQREILKRILRGEEWPPVKGKERL